MTILVVGASGSVGSNVLAGLVARGEQVRGISHYPAKLEKFPAGAEPCLADLMIPASLNAAFRSVKRVFLLTPLDKNEIQMGLNAVAAAHNAGVERIVHMSVPMPPGAEQIPHFRNKTLIEKKIKESGADYTILRPNNFFQNDLWGQAAIMTYNSYPQPIGNKGVNRVDSRDVADAAINALLNDGFENQEFTIHGSDALTGEQTAAIFSKHLGREIYYGGDDLDNWAKQAQHMMPAWMVENFKTMFRFYQTEGLTATAEELEKQQAIVGHPPRTFDAFVEELAKRWS